MENSTLENQIYKCREIRKTLNHKDKNLITYLENLQKVLNIFGYKKLRENQEAAVYHLLKGDDLLFVTPTAGGKSMCYIAPALSMGLKTIVFSPLVSLIQDQSEKLKEKGLKVGVISSAVTAREKKLSLALWENDELDFLFVAPERLGNKDFIEVMRKKPPEFIVVDEIHCAYEHSDTFRPSYKAIAPFVEEMKPKLFLGLTATMSKEIEGAIRQVFKLEDTTKIVKAYNRKNLVYSSFKPTTCDSLDLDLLHIINQAPHVPTIVYFSTVALVEQTYKKLARVITGGCMAYTGKMTASSRESNQNNFIKGNIRVAFATNSFGMGVDKPDIGRVIFRTLPGTIEELTQGFGRGGRNGCNCECILMGDIASIETQEFFNKMQFPSPGSIKQFFNTLKMLRNSEGHITQSLSSICNTAGIDSIYSSAIINILKGYKVIDREEKTTIGQVRFLDTPDENDSSLKKYKEYYDKISFLGLENKSYLDIDILYLAEELGVGIETVKKNLKAFDELGLIEYIPPYSTPPLKLIGDISLVDFDTLEIRKQEKNKKLNEVLKYYKLDDSKKSEFLFNYFNSQNNG